MTDDARSPTRVPWVGPLAAGRDGPSRCVGAAPRRSSVVRLRVACRGHVAAHRCRVVGAQRLRNRTQLGVSRKPTTRRRAIAGIEALGTEIAQLPEPPPATSNISVVLLIDGSHTGFPLPDVRRPLPDVRRPLPDVRRQREVIAVLHGETARVPSFATSVLPTLDGEVARRGLSSGAHA